MHMPLQPGTEPRYRPYLSRTTNTCPDCGGQQWHVGRVSAQCAICDSPLPLANPGVRAFHH